MNWRKRGLVWIGVGTTIVATVFLPGTEVVAQSAWCGGYVDAGCDACGGGGSGDGGQTFHCSNTHTCALWIDPDPHAGEQPFPWVTDGFCTKVSQGSPASQN